MISLICAILIASLQVQSIYAHYGEGIIEPRSSPFRGSAQAYEQYGNGGSKGGGEVTGSQHYDEGRGNGGGKGGGQTGGSFHFHEGKHEGRGNGNGKGGFGFGTGIGGMLGQIHAFNKGKIDSAKNAVSQFLEAAFQHSHEMMSNYKNVIGDIMGTSQMAFVHYWRQMEEQWNNFLAGASNRQEIAYMYLEGFKIQMESVIREFHAKKHQMTLNQIQTLKYSVMELRQKIEKAMNKVRENSKGYFSDAAQNFHAKLEYMHKELTNFLNSLNEKMSQTKNEMGQHGQKPNNPSQQGQSHQHGQTQQHGQSYQPQGQEPNQQQQQRPPYPPSQQQSQFQQDHGQNQQQQRPPHPPSQQQSQFEQQQQNQKRPYPQTPDSIAQNEQYAKE